MKKLIVLMLLVLSPIGFAQLAEPVDKIVAVVNDQVITATELQNRITQIEANLKQSGTVLPPETVIRKQVLDHLIMDAIQLQMAKRADIEISAQALKQAVLEVAKNNHQTLAGLKASLVKNGLTYAAFKKQLKQQLTMEKLQGVEIGPTIKINQAAVETLRKQMQTAEAAQKDYHLKDILIPLPEEPTSADMIAARGAAMDLVKALKKGKPFSQAAIGVSTGQNALKGGDMGWHKLAGLPEVFATKVVAMKVGDVSAPLQTANGFHILKLVAVRTNVKAKKLTKQDRLHQARALLFQRQFNLKLQGWLQRIRAGAYIKLY